MDTQRSDAATSRVNCFALAAPGLDGRSLLLAIERLDLTPEELHANGALEHWLEREGERVKVARLDKGSQHTWCVLEVLLGIDHKILLQVHGPEVPGELPSDDQCLGHRCRCHGGGRA